MSYGNAVKQREEMLSAYKKMLENETDQIRIADIEKQILLIQDQISQLKVGKPLFGKVKPLNITTTFIEPNPEKPGEQIVTIINPKPVVETVVAKEEVVPAPSKNARLENDLRKKIQAAKAAKKV